MKTVKNIFSDKNYLNIDIQYEGRKYCVKMERFRLIVEDAEGSTFWETEIYSYYDCLAYTDGLLFWGERCGLIHCMDFRLKVETAKFYICEDAELFYRSIVQKYPNIPYLEENHLLGDYAWLPELHAMNRVCSQLSISAMTAYEHYLAVGDLSGRVIVVDIRNMERIFIRQIAGPIANIELNSEQLLVDGIQTDHYLNSPDELRWFEEAVQVEYSVKDFLG